MMTKMKIVFSLFFLITCFVTHAQKVSNIHAEQRGQDIVVLYSLETTSPCEVSLLLSQDNGATWGSPLKNVSGDVGKNISGGEKQIAWKVLDEQEYLVGDKMKFKVIANGRKFFEPEMVFVEGGTFQMGSISGESDDKPIHLETLRSFNIGKYEVTQAQWKAVMGTNPSDFTGCNNCPVETVSWNEVQEFIMQINSQTGKNYRLPSEAEWEYAAKGGKGEGEFPISDSESLNSTAWFVENSNSEPHGVGGKKPNELGVYDMIGNLWEWCADWYGDCNSNNETNLTGKSSGKSRVIRGGSWYNDSSFCNTTFRMGYEPNNSDRYVGFRLVLPVE